jgi:hypothetical protein
MLSRPESVGSRGRKGDLCRCVVHMSVGHFDTVFFEKFVHFGDVTQVRVNSTRGLWIKGPRVLMHITRDGKRAVASARLTAGNTLIWGIRQVAVRLEGNLGKTAALAIANPAALILARTGTCQPLLV